MPEPLDRVDRARLQRLLGDDALADLRRRLRKRYQRATAPDDGFTLNRLSTPERDALAGLLGRKRSTAASMRLSHQALDNALRQAELAPNLRTALETLDGAIVDTAARRERERQAWAGVFEGVTDARLADILLRATDRGLIKRLAAHDIPRAEKLLQQSQRVLARLPAAGISRSRLAADILGDAHGLDPGRPIATLLRRALDPERELPRQRDVWATQGIMVSELAKPVLVLNLPAGGDGMLDRLLATARAMGEPLHLSLRHLLRTPPQWQREQAIFVCENPDVVAAAADELGADCPPLISIDGQLSAAPRTLLDQLDAADSQLNYHGDFDWPGLTIGNGIITRYGARPWRFSARDYTPTQGVSLDGKPVAAIWDASLQGAMQDTGLAMHEERQLPALLSDLADARRP